MKKQTFLTILFFAIIFIANYRAEARVHCLNCEDSTGFTTTVTFTLSLSCSANICFFSIM